MKAICSSGDVETLKPYKKLHVQWWQAIHAQMKNIFQLADSLSRVIDHCQTVVYNCKVCREWAKPLSEAVASIEITTEFHHQVELDAADDTPEGNLLDKATQGILPESSSAIAKKTKTRATSLLFHGKHILLNMVDRCKKWHAAVEIPDKTMGSIIAAVQAIWALLHGGISDLIVDGEIAVKSWQADKDFGNHTTKPIVLAPGQYARFFERRGAFLSKSIKRIQSDLWKQGVEGVPVPYILAEAVFCVNALLFVNNTTPYVALYGRVPNILPDIDRTGSATPEGILPGGSGLYIYTSSSTEGILPGGRAALPNDGSGRREVSAGLSPVLPGSIRQAKAVREATAAAMVQQMAHDQVNRANKTTTLPAARYAFKEEMTMEFFRPSSQKDIVGWYGPAVITNCDKIPRGVITIKHKTGEMKFSPDDLRPHRESFVCHVASRMNNVTANALTAIQQAAHHLQDKAVLNLGCLSSSKGILPEGTWQTTKSTETQIGALSARWRCTDYSRRSSKRRRIHQRMWATIQALAVSWDSNYLDELTYHWLEPNSVLNFKLSGIDFPQALAPVNLCRRS